MTNTEQEIRAELIKLIERYAPTLAEVAKVISVDEASHTCLLRSASDDSEFTASLSAGEHGSAVIIPALNSVVFTRKAENGTYYITNYSEAEKIVMFKGELGGMVKVNNLVDKLNKIEETLNKIINAFDSWIPVPNDGGLALKNIISTQRIASVDKTGRKDLENPKITQ